MLAAAVLLTRVQGSEAVAQSEPDLRRLLSNSKNRFFIARVAEVAWRPGPVTQRVSGDDAALIQGIGYWLRAGQEYERREGVRLTSPDEIVKFGFTWKPSEFKGLEPGAWSSIALARAASGDLAGAATMLETGNLLYPPGNDTAMMASDAAALRIQQAIEQDDVRPMLDALVHLESAILFTPFPRRSREPLRKPEAHFNKALILEQLGLHVQAVESYRSARELHTDMGWSEETDRRIQRLSQPSRRERWEAVRNRLETAAREGKVDAVGDVVRPYADHARTAAEKEYLGNWARSIQAGNAADAAFNLTAARNIGKALLDSFGESLVSDAVRTIDERTGRGDSRAIEGLVRGHLLYQQTTLDRHRDGTAAATTLDEAVRAFDVAGSPMASVARFSAITARFDAAHIDDSLAKLRQLEQQLSPGHRALHALVTGAIGTSLAERGDLYDALEAFTRAQAGFEASGEVDSVARTRVSGAHMLTLMGQPVEAWRVRRAALRTAGSSGDPELLELVLARTASDEMFNREEMRALALYSTVLPRPPLYATPEPGRGMNHWRPPATLLSSEVILDSINDRPLRADMRNELRVAQAVSLCKRRPGEAQKLLSESIAYSEATGRRSMLPYVYFYRAIARWESRNEDEAIEDFHRAISLLEERRRNVGRRDLRDLWYRTADDAFHELTNLHWKRGENGAIFAAGERRRGLVFLDGVTPATNRVEPLTADQIAARVPDGVALVVLTSSPAHTLATVLVRNRVSMHRPGVATGYLLQKKRELRDAIQQDDLPRLRSVAEELHALLIEPLRIDSESIKRLVFVPDQPLHDIPFAVFRDRGSSRYLIERFEVARVASASVYAQTKATVPAALRSIVAIGDPAFDRRAYPAFPSLPAARAESRAVAQRYPESRVLTGEDATLRNLTAAVQGADVVHIGAHTAPDSGERQLLRLLLAPSDGHNGASSLAEIASLPLKKGTIVVMSGCRTAASREPGTLRDFAGSFLAAGGGSVVATLWDVNDDSAHSFALRFHRALVEHGSAAAATRDAQLAMLRSPNPQHHNPRAWSGFQVYGIGF